MFSSLSSIPKLNIIIIVLIVVVVDTIICKNFRVKGRNGSYDIYNVSNI